MLKDNVFINKDYFMYHHNLDYRHRRIADFIKLYNILKTHLKPKDSAFINEKKKEVYIRLHKKENQEIIRKILDKLEYVSFKDFYANLKNQIKKFNDYLKENNITKYVFVVGVGNDVGASTTDYNLYKSNFWIFLLSWKYLLIKPYDIILNFNTAIRLHFPKIKDFLIMDDCSYSGSQIVNNVLKIGSTELLFHNKEGYKIDLDNKTMFQPIQNKYLRVHLVIPYMSTIANDKINDLEIETGFDIIKYTSFLIKPYKDILKTKDLEIINKLYDKAYDTRFDKLIPIFFEYKIADMVSTIDLILIKGQVLDSDKRQIFIDACLFNKNDPRKYDLNPESKHFNTKKLYCPYPPYLEFEKIIKKNT